MKTYGIEGAKIYPISGEPFVGTIVVSEGKIAAVGENVQIPEGAERLDGTGKFLMPGFIDAHTHIGLYPEAMGWAGEDYNEKSGPITPQVDAIDSIYADDIAFSETLAGGVTTVMITPGSANVVGGQCVVLKTRSRNLVTEMLIRRHAGLKIAFGENPRRIYGNQGKMPTTRMGVAALLRETLQKAVEYRNKQRQSEDWQGPVDFGMEAIGRVIAGDMPLRAHAHRADDIATAIRIAKEFDLEIVIEHATEGDKIVDLLVEEDVPVIVGPTMTFRSKMEVKDRDFVTLAKLEKAGARFSITSDHPVVPCGYLPLYAGIAVRHGLSEKAALEAITIQPATVLGEDNRVGSIEVGKDADLVLWNGHPFSGMSKPDWVMVDGVLNRVDEQVRLTSWED